MGIAFLGHTLVLKPLGLYSLQMQPPFPWPGTARISLALFSLPWVLLCSMTTRLLLRGKEIVLKSQKPSAMSLFCWKESSCGCHHHHFSVPWTALSWRRSYRTDRILISELHGWINLKIFKKACQHPALFASSLRSLGASPGPRWVFTPPVCSNHRSVPASVIGSSGKRWTFTKYWNFLYVYRAAKLYGRYLLSKQGGFL